MVYEKLLFSQFRNFQCIILLLIISMYVIKLLHFPFPFLCPHTFQASQMQHWEYALSKDTLSTSFWAGCMIFNKKKISSKGEGPTFPTVLVICFFLCISLYLLWDSKDSSSLQSGYHSYLLAWDSCESGLLGRFFIILYIHKLDKSWQLVPEPELLFSSRT